MVAETRAYFRELIEKNLDASHLVQSDFAMLNEKLATHYGIPGVSGSQIRRVALPPDCPRGGFLTQAAILKVTANGTTTSPVPRGAFVMARLLGQPPEPPPPNIPAVEPDVRGATTIREQLDKHRADAACAVVPCEDRSARLRAGIVRRHRRLPRRATARSATATPRRAARSIRSSASASSSARPSIRPACCPTGASSATSASSRRCSPPTAERLLKNLAEQLAIYATGRDARLQRPRRRSPPSSRAPQKQGRRHPHAAARTRAKRALPDAMKNDSPFHRRKPNSTITRREFLWRSGGGLGGIALASMLGSPRALAGGGMLGGTLHHPAKAKRVVQFFMAVRRATLICSTTSRNS